MTYAIFFKTTKILVLLIGYYDTFMLECFCPATDFPAHYEFSCNLSYIIVIFQESYQNLITDDGFSNDDFVLTVDGKSFAVLMEHFSSLMPRICIKGAGRFKYHLHNIYHADL